MGAQIDQEQWTGGRVVRFSIAVVVMQALGVGIAIWLYTSLESSVTSRVWVEAVVPWLSHAPILVALYVTRKRSGRMQLWDWADLLSFKGLVALAAVLGVSFVVTSVTTGAPNSEVLWRSVTQALQSEGLVVVWSILYTGGRLALIPLVEEWLFRGVIQPVLVVKWGTVPGVVVTAVFFAGMHGSTLRGVMLVLGAIWGWFGTRNRSLAPLIMVHALYNAGYLML